MSRSVSANTQYTKDQIIKLTENLKNYWPLTLRQIYYQLVAAGYIENEEKAYKKLSSITTKMRNQGELSWAVMEDRTRQAVQKIKWAAKEEFIRQQLNQFLRGYSRCLVQQQENYVELWTEKDALSRIFEDVGVPYCVVVVVCKGHPSTTLIKEYADRAAEAVLRGQKPVIVYGGDLDPSGWQIPRSIRNRLANDQDIFIQLDRFALNPNQILKYNLPNNPNAMKWTDSNAKAFAKIYGETAVELDALNPKDLENEIRSALERHLDMSSINFERMIDNREREELRVLREQVIQSIEKQGISL